MSVGSQSHLREEVCGAVDGGVGEEAHEVDELAAQDPHDGRVSILSQRRMPELLALGYSTGLGSSRLVLAIFWIPCWNLRSTS